MHFHNGDVEADRVPLGAVAGDRGSWTALQGARDERPPSTLGTLVGSDLVGGGPAARVRGSRSGLTPLMKVPVAPRVTTRLCGSRYPSRYPQSQIHSPSAFFSPVMYMRPPCSISDCDGRRAGARVRGRTLAYRVGSCSASRAMWSHPSPLSVAPHMAPSGATLNSNTSIVVAGPAICPALS